MKSINFRKLGSGLFFLKIYLILGIFTGVCFAENPDFPNTESTAKTISLDYSVSGTIEKNDEDWFKFTLSKPEWVIIALYENKGGELFLQLKGNSSDFLNVYEGRDDTSSGYIYERTHYDDEGFIKAKLNAGTYYIRIYPDPDYKAVEYSLLAVITDEGPDFSGDFSAPSDLGNITSNNYSGYIDGEKGDRKIDAGDSGDEDWIKFNVTNPGTLIIDVKENGGEQYLLFTDKTSSGSNISNVEGAKIGHYSGFYAVREDTNKDNRGYIKADLQPGTFYLLISHTSSGRNDFRSLASLELKFSSTTSEWFRDEDGDTYGCDPSSSATCVSILQDTQPEGYVDNHLDCNDNDASIKPGAAEICNGVDDDCDGDVDNGLTDLIFYMDADGDGYGDEYQYIVACSAPSGYVTDKTDCNDNNAGINPGAFDSCATPIDENCSGSNDDCQSEPDLCADLSDSPLETQIESAPPLVMLVVDDSGSMGWDVLCPESNGRFGGNSYVSNVTSYWKSQWSGYNGIYYDTDLDYTPWPDSSAYVYGDADKDNPKLHPNDSATRSLSSRFRYLDGVDVVYSHFYTWSSASSKPYLINIEGSIGSYRVSYYKVECHDDCRDNHSYVNNLDPVSSGSVPSDVKIKRTAEEERQNFANWYKYYRTRRLTALSALAQVIDTSTKIKIGIHTLNHGNQVNMIRPRPVSTSKGDILKDLYNIDANGGTPLRTALKAVGQMYDSESSSPFDDNDTGGTCQQAYTILMSDGYYNGSSPNVGNADGDDSSDFDGSPYADTYSNTLADVAMHYYERDLNTNLANQVPLNANDSNPAQHMVTYTVSFGLKGTLDPDNYNCPDTSCPSWPAINSDDKKIDDLWHAAVNGRGEFLAANNAQQLAYTLEKLMNDIKTRTGSGASVAVNTQTLDSGTRIFQGSYNSNKWTGDLEAFSVNAVSGAVNTTPLWSAADKLDSQVVNNPDFYLTRNIFSYNTETKAGIEFTHNNLSDVQKTSFGSECEDIVNFIRGKRTKENKGGFRTRASLLGDIVHSAPVQMGNVIFVGANDGMLHCFNAGTGDEIFAYVPGFLYKYSRLKDLADPNYSHRYYVDNTPFISKLSNGNYMLVGGLGKGGKGYFSLDVSSVFDSEANTNFSSSDVKWEYPDSSVTEAEINNMGYSFSYASILRTNDNDNPNAVFFGNGYDSPSGKAVLYILSTDGTLIKMLDTETGGTDENNCNGLSSPSYIDTDNNGTVDYVYAGDMQGNVWKFDLTDSDPDNWGFSYKDNSGKPKPVFQARDSSGNKQPITSKIAVALHCLKNRKGYLLLFGTGSFNSVNDFDDSKAQSVYCIWDWVDHWEYLQAKPGKGGITFFDKYYGYFTSSGLKRLLSNIAASSYFSSPGVDLTLLEQGYAATSTDEKWETSSDNEINWFDPDDYSDLKISGAGEYKGGDHAGWYINLAKNGERVVADPSIRGGLAIIVTLDPSRSPCETGGNSYLRVFDLCSGGHPGIVFDTDGDNDLKDESDIIPSGLAKPPNALKLDDIYYKPVIVSDKKREKDYFYFGDDNPVIMTPEPTGVISWKIAD